MCRPPSHIPRSDPDAAHTLRARALLTQLIGRKHSITGENDRALDAYASAFSLFGEAGDPYNQARVRMRRALVLRAINQPAAAAGDLDKALDVLSSQAASQIRSQAAEQRAACARELGRPDEVIRFLEIALRDHEADRRPAAAKKVLQQIESHRLR